MKSGVGGDQPERRSSLFAGLLPARTYLMAGGTSGLTTMRGTCLLLLLAAGLSLTGCGRKNLPVSPSGAAVPIGSEADPGTPAAQSRLTGTQTFQRASRLSSTNDLTVSPAEVSRNPNAKTKTFLLDPLLN